MSTLTPIARTGLCDSSHGMSYPLQQATALVFYNYQDPLIIMPLKNISHKNKFGLGETILFFIKFRAAAPQPYPSAPKLFNTLVLA